MSYTVDQAYAEIKKLENSGQFVLPEPQATVDIGTIDAATGGFAWSVPTVQQTTVLTTLPGKPNNPNIVITRTVGVVNCSAVDLLLRFTVNNAPQTAPVGIQGFGLSVSGTGQVILDAQLACSAPISGETETGADVSPPVTTFLITITVQGRIQEIPVMILRPPVLGVGAFTLPALPITIIYAPPQGQGSQNYAQYTDTVSISRTIATSFTHGNSTKTAQAYTWADIAANISKAIEQSTTLLASGGSGGGTPSAPAAGSGSPGGSGSSGSQGNDSGSSGLKQASAAFGLLGSILNALYDPAQTSQTASVTVEDDHSITTTWTDAEMFGSQTSLGPGVGDRFVYLSDVRVVWVALNGEVSLVFLGFDEGVKAFTAQALTQDRQSLDAGQPAVYTGLDIDTIKMLLNLDPFCVTRVVTSVGPPLVSPPRFVPATPPEQSGEGTSTMGDQISASHEVTVDDKQVRTTVNMTVTDAKPGWLDVIFGSPNVESTQTLTCTVGYSTDTKIDEKVTDVGYFFSDGPEDTYDVMLFYDNLFGTLLFAEKGSPVLNGTTTVTTHAVAVAQDALP